MRETIRMDDACGEIASAVRAKASLAFFSKVDLGIAKCHFELAAGSGSFRWA